MRDAGTPGIDMTGWDFVSSEALTVTALGGPKLDVEYFECTRPPGDGTCSDDTCPCGYPGANIPRGSGYFYISKELVEMRCNALTIPEIENKVRGMQQRFGVASLTASQGVFMPILMCEMGAKKRGINLDVAAADARYYWETGLAPLRPTPMVGMSSKVEAGKDGGGGCFVLALLGLLLFAVTIPNFMKARETNQRNACIINMRQLNGAIEQAALNHNYKIGDIVSEQQVSEYLRSGFSGIVCPKGGRYKINPVGQEPECSEHGSMSVVMQRR
jgi:hypothetical protein